MSNRATSRVQKELRDFKKCQEAEDFQLKIEPKDDNFMELTGEMVGPPDTPYEGGTFVLDIKLPKNYPMAPPKVSFVTKVWHPNISSEDGEICLDTLGKRWAATLTLRTVLLSIQLLLSSARGNDALDHDAGRQYRKSRELFNRTARHWTNVYARGPNREIELEEMVKQLKDMGREEVFARRKLSIEDWVLEKAVKSFQEQSNDGNNNNS